jgi:hypothetical protein
MTTYRIENMISGVILGDYEGATEAEALDAMARDAGYADYAALCNVVPVKDGEISIGPAPMKFRLSVPNDFGSEADSQKMLADVYGIADADSELGGCDLNQSYEPIANAAKGAGLKYVSETDYGAIWEGTEAQFNACLEILPGWARPYASTMEENG